MNLDVGSVVGDYQIIGILGAGGMGKVFKVRNTISDRVEAMKVLLPDLAATPELADRFLREIKVTASLDHPNIASLRTALRFGNQLLMVMELVDGVDLEAKLKQQGKLTAAEAANYIGQVLDALAYAHRLGVIHRDIKPPNMMLTPQGVIKLMDFGIAKGAADAKLTMTGTTMGSLYYMSPEQIQGATDLDKRTDLYALGVSLYELVTGRRPFDGDSQFAIMAAHLQCIPVPPVTIDPLVPAALNDVILHSVEKNPDERYQSAEEFHAALRTAVTAPATVRMPTAPLAAAGTMAAGTTVAPPAQATVVTPLVADAPPPKSKRLLWIGAGAFCAIAAVVGIIEFGPSKQTAAGSGAATPVQSVTPPIATPSVATPPASSPPVETKSIVSATPPKQRGHVDAPPVQSQSQPQVTSTPPISAPPPQQQQVQPVPQSAPPQPTGPSPQEIARRAELKKVGDAFNLLQVRAGAIHSRLSSLERQQNSTGMGLRPDWVSGRSRMDLFLKQSENALSSGDPAAAKDALDKAERQVELLEKALNM